MPIGVKAKDIMKKGVITSDKKDTILTVSKTLAKARIGGVVITDKGTAVGMLTEGDIIRKVLAKGKDPSKTKAGQVMTKNIKAITPGTDVEKIARILRDNQIERLPVVHKGHLIGIITERDLIKIEPSIMDLLKERAVVYPSWEDPGWITGLCDSCGNYANNLAMTEQGAVCENCRGD